MEASRYEPLSTVEPHLTWASWDILTLCLVLVAGAYVVSTVWELGFGQVSSVLKQIEQLNQESVAHAPPRSWHSSSFGVACGQPSSFAGRKRLRLQDA